MGKLMLLLVTVSTIVGMLLHGSIEEKISGADQRFVEHGSKVVARELAMTGLNDALQDVIGDFGSGSYTGTTGPDAIIGNYDNGDYSIALQAAGSSITITVEIA